MTRFLCIFSNIVAKMLKVIDVLCIACEVYCSDYYLISYSPLQNPVPGEISYFTNIFTCENNSYYGIRGGPLYITIIKPQCRLPPAGLNCNMQALLFD